ncbi:RnfABCDGE type electron transport complex subunit G [Sporomusa acidovorans]|uniref:Ion-translocating oxidoreductase complex subunit G n=1 Tax=Sporomusa acidovorans (strain ATCC 49682 / DSM 3132 / Mol) TaxID=1123286 RepID=A0ABZ3J0P1_SPOA4|nr:RnfABCDGE type electron transport complex subunit G [Sporomusa acidovorans]OZC22497.1 electron transport complex subunit RnfG [Sporomusa acidovorans DSM 3132]SDE73560.1 electron transport complex protein RnfG [Sporomusa acidovorans]
MAHDEHTHEDKNNSVFKIAMNLAITCFISGAIIATTFAITEPAAAEQRVKAKNDAMRELVKDAESFNPIDGKDGWYGAMKGGKVVAYVVPASSKGYGGAIEMLAAVTPDGKAMDYKVLKHNETPGLGDKMVEPKFRKQFANKTANDMEVVKVPTDKNIQALTGATITSRAVTKGIKEAVEAVAAYSATQKK